MEDKIKELIREEVKEVIQEMLTEASMFDAVQDLEVEAQSHALTLFRNIAKKLSIKEPDELLPEERELYRKINQNLKETFRKITIDTIRALNGFPLRAKKTAATK